MSATSTTAVRESATKRAGGLRFPVLFVLMALLFVIDLLVPDFIPFVDEIILGLVTVVLGTLRERRKPPKAERVDT